VDARLAPDPSLAALVAALVAAPVALVAFDDFAVTVAS